MPSRARPSPPTDGAAFAAQVRQALAVGRLDLALQASAGWAATAPSTLRPRILLSGLCHRLGAFKASARQAELASALDPSVARPLDALGVLAADRGEAETACRFANAALRRSPADAALLTNFGSALRLLGRTARAVRILTRARALAPDPADGAGKEALYNLANALSDNAPSRAIRLFATGVAACPAHAKALGNMGYLLNLFSRGRAAERALSAGLALAPDEAAGMLNLGNSFRDARDFETAARFYDRARALDPSLDAATINRFDVALHGADLETRQRLQPEILAHVADAVARGEPGLVAPITLLHLPVTPHLRRRQADLLARALLAKAQSLPAQSLPARPVTRSGPLTVGYLSGDFRDHAIGHLMAGLFPAHDRQRVRVVALSTGPDDGSRYRRTYERRADRFIDAALMTDQDLAAAVVAEGVDILVDVSGHTKFDRLPVVAAHPAPVTVHFLGYPGPAGAGLVDWMIADPVLAEEETHLSTPLAILPDCYQANDRQQEIGRAGERRDHGLPEGAFVFAGLVAPAKLGPETLDLWVATVSPLDNAVLWLLSPGPAGEKILSAYLAAKGLAAERVIFAPRAPKPDHLARQKHADLALDSLIYGGHTTTSDALWAGLPVLTVKGDGFAAKVATSLLTAIGLPELIATDQADFTARAQGYARNPDALATLKQRLAAQRLTTPLFDTARFASHIEDAYEEMAHRARKGEKPSTFRIAARD
ncbi:MAG: hypothetical protein NXI16_05135 [Alphaproteobacteria bacterium]|nr:hypothetical protein [Alphaproteobacteria bacterium]